MADTTTADQPNATPYQLADPERKHTRSRHTFFEFLDANPGQWAIYKEYTGNTRVARIKACQWRKAYGHLGYDFTQRVANGSSTLYGRKVVPELADNTRD